MRKVVIPAAGGHERLTLVDTEAPRPAPGEVRIAVTAIGVNYADCVVRMGLYESAKKYVGWPITPGFEVAGVVDALGEGVTAFAVGDEVVGKATGGGYAEEVVANVRALVRKPAEVGWETAAALPVGATTAYRALALLGLGEGDHTGTTIVIDGAAGAVGVFAVQLAVARGATVIGSAGEAHQDELRALGATPVVYGEGLADRVRAVAPNGVDLGFDTSGYGGLRDLVALTGSPEKAITIADYAGAQELGVTFTSGGDPDDERRALTEALDLLAAGRLRAPTVVTYPLAEAGKAQDDNQTRRVAGKLVLLP